MVKSYEHIKHFVDFFGIDLRSSELLRPRGYASDGTQNTIHTPQGGMTHRWGSKLISASYGMYGVTRFDTTSMLGVAKSEIIAFGGPGLTETNTPYRLVRSSFTLTNSHATLPATVNHWYDETTADFRFNIARGGSTLINQDLNIGTEGSPYMLSSLETAVDALTSMAMSTPTLASTTPAAFMEIINAQTIAAAGGTLTVYYWYWELLLTTPTAVTFASLKNAALEFGSTTFRNVSSAALGNVLYISPGRHTATAYTGGTASANARLCKYDGQRFYRAGMRAGMLANLTGTNAAGTYTDSKGAFARTVATFAANFYKMTFKQVDKAGNVVEGDMAEYTASSPPTAPTGSTVASVQVTSGDLDLAAQGFNTAFAVAAGVGAAGLIFTVDDGAGGTHTLKVGDIGYFWDGTQSRFVQREITVVSATQVTFSTTSLDTDPSSINFDSGGNVTLRDNAVISANLRVCVWRTEGSPSSTNGNDDPFFLVDEIPYSTLYTSSFYYDSKNDSALGAEYVPPAYSHGLPPSGRYLATYNGDQLLIAGDELNPLTVFFSDEGPEYFPPVTHSFDMERAVEGVRQSGDVIIIGAKKQIFGVTGDLRSFNFRVERIGNEIGILAHDSMREINEGILAFETERGPYVILNGRQLEPLGGLTYSDNSKVSRIEPFFTRRYSATEEQPCFERAVAGVLSKERLYLLFVPFEDPAKPGFATTNSVTWVFDYGRGTWHKWTGIGMAGGIAELDDVLYFAGRAHNGSAGAIFSNVVSRTSQLQRDKAQYNYADHDAAISYKWRSNWEALGEPGQFKRFLRCRLSSHEPRLAASTPLNVKTYVNYSTTTPVYSDTLTWATQLDIKTKIAGGKCRALMMEYSSTAYYKPFPLSGYELEAVASFKQEFKE